MESADDLSYKIIFSGDGAGRLRDRVKEKLKEFMGDYTDDTLVEYVIVLLKNGRRKEEAKNELNVFLGDDSDAFVSWLWDHLQSNLNLYAQPKDSSLIVEQVAKQKPQSEAEVVKEVVKSDKLSKSRRVKDWKGVIRESAEPPPLRSAVIATVQSDNENHVNRSSPPQPFVHKKRGRSSQTDFTDESSQVKRAVSKSTVGGASRRLLQFAVRDAVGNSRSVGLTSEPSHKRLRSAVSTPTDESSLEERPPKIRSVARVPKAMEVAIKAVADAAQDVKVKSSGTVFDRLSHGSTEVPLDNEKHEADVPTYSGQYIDASMMEHDGRVGNNQSKMVNIHSNVNKHSGVSNSDNQKLVQPIASGESHDNNLVTASNGNGVPVIHAQKVVDQKTVPSPGVNPAVRSTDDMDSRSIFVSNVHFAATKDSISRHFNKFGEVLKVVILTEAATGQPKGSAYVEFMRKEDAENALSLDGTSFMSRILKVVKKSSGQQEAAAPVTTWPRGARGSPFAASRFGRVPFPRVSIPSPYRPRLPIKGGARSFQWKRDAQNSSSDGLSSPVAIPSPTTITPRSLTYVRTEAAKPI